MLFITSSSNYCYWLSVVLIIYLSSNVFMLVIGGTIITNANDDGLKINGTKLFSKHHNESFFNKSPTKTFLPSTKPKPLMVNNETDHGKNISSFSLKVDQVKVGHQKFEKPDVEDDEEEENSKSESLRQWIFDFNDRFESMRKCRYSWKCLCLWNLKHLRTMASLPERFTSIQIMSNLPRRRMALVLLSSVFRIGKAQSKYFQSTEPFERDSKRNKIRNSNLDDGEWFRCSLTDSICEDQTDVTDYYSKNRQHMVKMLMRTAVNVNYSSSIYSYDFVIELDDVLRRLSLLLAGDDDDSTDDSRSIPRSSLESFSSKKILDDNGDKEENSTTSYHYRNCFGREDLLREMEPLADVSARDPLILVEQLALFIVDRLSKGQCIELLESRYLRDIITRYGQSTDVSNEQNFRKDQLIDKRKAQSPLSFIDRKGFFKMLNDLHIGGLIEKQKETKEIHFVAASNVRKLREPRSVSQNDNAHHNHVDHQHPHHHHHPHHSDDQTQHEISNRKTFNTECLDHEFYLKRLKSLNKPSSKSKESEQECRITENDLRQLAPIFVQQIVSRACERIENYDDNSVEDQLINLNSDSKIKIVEPVEKRLDFDSSVEFSENLKRKSEKLDSDKKTNQFKAFLYANIGVGLVSLGSLIGILVIPFLRGQWYSCMNHLFIGLAFSSMSGDALFHLLPAILNIHSHSVKKSYHHDEDEHHHHRSEDSLLFNDPHLIHDHSDSKQHLFVMMAVAVSIYLLYLFEVISNAIAKRKRASLSLNLHSHSHHHHHHNHHHPINRNHNFNDSSYESSLTIDSIATDSTSQSMFLNTNKLTSELASSRIVMPKNCDNKSTNNNINKQDDDNVTIGCGMTSLVWIITISDSIHNFLDGIAIGIAFNSSISSGISTTIAVLFHEIPHELGDFSVMLSNGLSVRRAAFINLISALTAFLGLYLGWRLGDFPAFSQWSLAICAGMFLYVALCDMLPELKNDDHDENIDESNEEPKKPFSFQWFLFFVSKNFGIITGFVCMALLAYFEDQLNWI